MNAKRHTVSLDWSVLYKKKMSDVAQSDFGSKPRTVGKDNEHEQFN